MQSTEYERATPLEIARFVSSSQPGDQLVYWTGHLAEDRMVLTYVTHDGVSSKLWIPREPADSIAHAAWLAYSAMDVELTQQRWGDKFKYIMTRRHN